MADNVGYTPGSGATVAADEIGGVLYQRVKPVVGVDGTATDVSSTDPLPIAAYGELIEAIESLRMAVGSLAKNMATLMPDQRGAIYARILEGTLTTVSTVSTVSTVTTCNTVSAVTNIGSRNAADLVDSNIGTLVAPIRNNIVVT
jgi:hypothetical protein